MAFVGRHTPLRPQDAGAPSPGRPCPNLEVPLDDEPRQTLIDEEQLRLLTLGYYVSAGVSLFGVMFGLMYVSMGVFASQVARTAPSPGVEPMPEAMFWMMSLFGGGLALVALAIGLLRWFVARAILARRRRVMCLLVAGLTCMEIPYGTVLGVLTFIVLNRPSVVKRFLPAVTAASEPAGAGK